jgi:hypothetical protein
MRAKKKELSSITSVTIEPEFQQSTQEFLTPPRVVPNHPSRPVDIDGITLETNFVLLYLFLLLVSLSV